MSKLRVFLEAIKFEHTIFALPFAYLGMLLAAQGWPTWHQFIWITVAMGAARTMAMALNRVIDRELDAANPRTAARAVPRGLLRARDMWLASGLALAILTIAAWQLNPLCLALLPGAVVVLGVYSYTKRFTWLSHAVLGVADGLAPIGAWVGVTGELSWPPLVLGLAVAVWIAGFDLLYTCQDLAFDQSAGLYSFPARFGVRATLWTSGVLHVATIALLALVGLVLGLGLPYWLGVLGAAGLLIYEHSLLRPNDLSRLDLAFFNVNGYIAVLLFVATGADFAVRFWWSGA